MKDFISVNEAAKKAGISVNTFYHHIEKKQVPYEQVEIFGKSHYQIPTLEFVQWLEQEAKLKQGKANKLLEAAEDLRNGR